MQTIDIEQRYRKRQIWRFWVQLLVVLSIFLSTLLNSSRSMAPDDRASLLGTPAIFYVAFAVGLALVSMVLGRWSVNRWSRLDIRDSENQARLHDEHERAIRYRAESHTLHTVLYLQALLYGWVVLQPVYALPVLPTGIPQVTTLLVAHLVFWIPYLQKTK